VAVAVIRRYNNMTCRIRVSVATICALAMKQLRPSGREDAELPVTYEGRSDHPETRMTTTRWSSRGRRKLSPAVSGRQEPMCVGRVRLVVGLVELGAENRESG